MESQTIFNLSNKEVIVYLLQKKWNIINDQSNASYDTKVLKSNNLCDYNSVYIIISGKFKSK